MRWVTALLLGLWLIASLAAAVNQREDALVTPETTVPVTLAAGSAGSTTIGAAGTSAGTSAILSPTLPIQVLKVLRGSLSWRVEVDIVSASGMGTGESFAVRLSDGTSVLQDSAVGNLFGPPTITNRNAPVQLASAGPDVEVLVAPGTCLGCTVVLEILIYPPAAGSPLVKYSYTVNT